jgi:hypothetical protein
MADNIEVTAGTGTVVHADEYTHATYGAGKTQLVKLALGAPGTGVEAVAGAGAVSTGVQRVTLASDDPAVVALQILDNAISGSEMQVDIVGALPAGTNAIGKLAANSGVDIGDVDITSIAAGDNNIGNVDIASIAAGDNNIGNVDVASVVPGTGATALGKAIDTAVGATDTGVGALVKRVNTLVTVTPADGDWIPPSANARGAAWVEIDTTNEVAHDAVDSGAPAKIGGYASTTAPTAVTAADRVNAWFNLNGAQVVVTTTASYSASATFTPAAASHAAGDCHGAAQEFALSAPSAGRIMITSASLEIDGGTAEATAWYLYLFNVTPPSAVADDGAFTLASGDRASHLGRIELGTALDIGDTQWVETHGINKHIKLAGTSVFGYLVNATTLTPANVAHIVTLHAIPV